MDDLRSNTVYLFDWGNTLMIDFPQQQGKMCDWPYVEAVEDAGYLLSHLAKHHPIYIATNAADSNQADIAQAFARVGLDQYLSGYFCYANLGLAKGSAEFYLKIAEQLGVETNRIIMVGDTLNKDVYPALEAGLNAIWFNATAQIAPKANLRQINKLRELL